MSVESEDEIKVRAKRNARLPLQYSGGRSPLPVTYCVNYNQQEHADWVKPLFSSIVYRLSVTWNSDLNAHFNYVIDLTCHLYHSFVRF